MLCKSKDPDDVRNFLSRTVPRSKTSRLDLILPHQTLASMSPAGASYCCCCGIDKSCFFSFEQRLGRKFLPGLWLGAFGNSDLYARGCSSNRQETVAYIVAGTAYLEHEPEKCL